MSDIKGGSYMYHFIKATDLIGIVQSQSMEVALLSSIPTVTLLSSISESSKQI